MSSIIAKGGASGTGSMTILAPNTNSNQVATLPDATGTVVVAGANSAITSGTAVASTSGTSIDFTGIPSWAKRITVMLNGVSTNGASNLLIQIGSGSFTTSGYFSTSTGMDSTVATTSYTTGFGIRSGNASNVLQGTLTLNKFNVASNDWIAMGITGANNNGFNTITSGQNGLSGTLDRVRITTVNGTDTFDAGSINILYE